MIIKCDFHIHSCVSPCGDLSMSPSYIAEVLAEKGVQLAALTDHNTALNCPAFAAACKKFGIAALYGMEVQSQEEVHVLSLFSDLQTALDFSNEIYEMLPPIMKSQYKTVLKVLSEINADTVPCLILLNKTDLIPDEAYLLRLKQAFPDSIPISVKNKSGFTELKNAIANKLQSAFSSCLDFSLGGV